VTRAPSARHHALVVNRDQLRELLDREGVNPAAYSLEGGHPPETYVLDSRPGRWAVYYSERGLEQGFREFVTEHEACESLLDELRHDETTHFHLVVGPLPPSEADAEFDRWRDEHQLGEESLSPEDVRIDNPVLRPGESVRRYWVRGTKLPRP
jgi:hypothetical protein